MSADDMSPAALVGLAIINVVAGALAGVWVSRRTGWAPAGGLALLVATPLVPHVPILSGLSLDDILPLLGIGFLATTVDLRRVLTIRVPWLLVVGITFLVVAGSVSSLVNASSPAEAVTMLLRFPGRYAYLALIALLVGLAEPADRRYALVARAMALVGSAEAVFGLAAFFLPLGGIGLEPTRRFSVLYFEVPGRIAGTLGISANFLGAVFVLTIVLTTGLAIGARPGRDRILWWASVLTQMLALTLTFTRASLGVAVVMVAILLLMRGRIRFLVPVLFVVAIGFLVTPSRPIDTGSSGSVGPQAPVAIERLTSDVPDRFALWYSATLMMIDHPLTGIGPGRMLDVANSNPARYINTPVGQATSSAHNTILLAGAEAGVLAAIGSLLVNFALFVAVLRLLWRRRRPAVIETAAALAVLGYLAQGMVNNLFTVAASGVIFAVVIGAYVIRLEPEPSTKPAAGDLVHRQRATATPLEPTV